MRHTQALLAFVFIVSASVLNAADTGPAGIEFFESKIRPILVEHCYSCHSKDAKKLKGKLRVDSLEALLQGGESGPSIIPKNPEKSLFIEAISYKNTEMQMPPKSKLSDAQIADLTDWVRRGAPWPASIVKEHSAVVEDFDLEKRKAAHWAWSPVRPRTPPAVKNSAWPKSPIDNFILVQLEQKNIQPAPPAEKRLLVRRAYFSLIGLPPTPEETESFVNDASPDAFAKVIDALLASPHFGERWGRHWLDLVRYAESRGHEFDPPTPNAFQYRDYVIRAINADLPYDQFVKEHLAGDLLPTPRKNPKEGFNESIIGTAFWFLGEMVHSPVDIRLDEAERFDNMVDVTCKSFLGLTVACARCHDHKFDAISTKDYYSFFGFLQSSSYRLARFDSLDHNRVVARELWRVRADQAGAVAKNAARSLRPEIEKVSAYLLASRAALSAAPELFKPAKDAKPNTPVKFADAATSKIQEVASAQKIDAGRLENWIAFLLQAARSPSDPFHAWAKIAADPKAQEPQHLAHILKPLLDAAGREFAAIQSLKADDIVIDFAAAGPGNWMPDDVSFGPAPAQPGEIIFSSDPARPIARIADRGAAEFDPIFEGLKLAANAAQDPVGLNYMRAGKTIRTPTFALNGNRVYFQARGGGRAYVVVDSHAILSGPLHGKVVQKFDGRDAAWHWHGFDLKEYKGHRAHIEFTSESADCAISQVLQTEKAPVLKPNALLTRMLAAGAPSPEALAENFQTLLLTAASHFESGKLSAAPDAADSAQLINWMATHRQLIPFGGETRSFSDAQSKLIAQIKFESRLTMAMMDGSGEDDYVMIRGSWKKPGDAAPRQLIEGIAGKNQPAIKSGSGRLELAERMTAASNPFFSRVMANRIWHHVIGRGIVPSVDNFGLLGETPTHPELLDFLAARFVTEGWSVKKMIRSIMLSSTYQMSSVLVAATEQADPLNSLLHRMHVRRLEGEAIRDSVLALSGRLDRTLYGPSVPTFLTDFMQGRGRTGSGPIDGNGRRSIYLGIQRNFLSPMMLAFDTPIPFNTMGRRSQSNVPAQALILMNDPFIVQQAELWAKRVIAAAPSPEQRIARMYLSAFARPPSSAEITAALAFIDQQTKELGAKNSDDPRLWADLAHVLINTKEFIFLN